MQRVSQDLKAKEQVKEQTERFKTIINDANETAEFVQFLIRGQNLKETTEKLKFLCENLLDPTTTYDLREIISFFNDLAENENLEENVY